MTRTYDPIVRGGEVVNHSGRGPTDVGVGARPVRFQNTLQT